MTISVRVQSELFSPLTSPSMQERISVVRMPATLRSGDRNSPRCSGVPWTAREHERFLQGLEIFPSGPWQRIADVVGTRTRRQTMTHAQKYRAKIARSRRMLKRHRPYIAPALEPMPYSAPKADWYQTSILPAISVQPASSLLLRAEYTLEEADSYIRIDDAFNDASKPELDYELELFVNDLMATQSFLLASIWDPTIVIV